MAVFGFRLLQFHQTLVGSEVSFVICLRISLSMHMHFLLVTSENVLLNSLYISFCVEKTLHGCRFFFSFINHVQILYHLQNLS